jgi:hypothetical protein
MHGIMLAVMLRVSTRKLGEGGIWGEFIGEGPALLRDPWSLIEMIARVIVNHPDVK